MTDISPEAIKRLVERLRNPSQQWNVTEACADAADAITALRRGAHRGAGRAGRARIAEECNK